mmetsp:Transcript_29596/g.92051  ORF Transcript_29596/g.92051 Transcript_29596/m.92051 type:complete len:201 (-) Transcript_29596:214-816(-)
MSEGNRDNRVRVCSFAKDHRMLAMFCGIISCRLCTDTLSTCEKSRGCCRPTAAKAHTVFDSSCGLKRQIFEASAAASPSAWKSSALAYRFLANAQSVLETSWGFISVAYTVSSLATLSNTAKLRRWRVAKDHAIVERHCTLNSPSSRLRSPVAMLVRRSVGHKDSLAYAQMRFDCSYGLSSHNRLEVMSAMAKSSGLWRS